MVSRYTNRTYIQKISNKVCVIRDRAVVKTTERMLKANSRVLVVYGGSHLITQEPSIGSMMGKATYFHATEKLASEKAAR